MNNSLLGNKYDGQIDKVWEQHNSFFDPQTKSFIYVNEKLAEKDRDVYNYCRKEKQFKTATHKNQVRVKVSEHDKTWYPVDILIQADAIGNTMVSTSEVFEWGMEKYPTNAVNMDERKTGRRKSTQMRNHRIKVTSWINYSISLRNFQRYW